MARKGKEFGPVRHRTFTGCQTCRKRKIKCDGRRPRCVRCEKSGVDCLGYDIKLKFCDPLIIEDDESMGTGSQPANSNGNYQRSQIPFVEFPRSQKYRYWEDIDDDLDELSEGESASVIGSNEVGDIKKGPFGRFETLKRQKLMSASSMTISSILNAHNASRSSSSTLSASISPRASKAGLPAAGVPARMPSDVQVVGSSPMLPAVPLRSGVFHIDPSTSMESQGDSSTADGIIPRKIWIHPRLQIDALLTYKTLLGDTDAEPENWIKVQQVVFSDYYDTTHKIGGRIVDQFRLSPAERRHFIESRMSQVLFALKEDRPIRTFTGLLMLRGIQTLLQLFVKTCRNMLFLSYKGNVLEEIVVPTVYKVVGELMIMAQEEVSYVITLKKSLAAITLAIASFNQYRVLFNSFGLYGGSMSYLRCYISFRAMALVRLSELIIPLIGTFEEGEPIEIKNPHLVDELVSNGMIKELIITLIIAIKQDEALNVIQNYKILFSVLEGLREYLLEKSIEDNQLTLLLSWAKYCYIFFRSTSMIDVKHYKIKEAGFEDLDANYNLIKKFTFDDTFEPEGYGKIEINSREISESEGTDSEEEELERPTLPKRLANRPPVEDRPPRSFTIRFRYNESDDDNDDDDDDDDDDGDNEQRGGDQDGNAEKKKPLMEPRVDKGSVQNRWKDITVKTTVNDEGEEVDVITGLKMRPSQLPKETEELTHKKSLLKIPVPFDIQKVQGISPVELCYGLPSSLIDILLRLITIADHKNWFQRKKVFPRNFPKFCCDLEEDLINWELPWDLYTESDQQVKEFHSDFHEAVYHLTLSFYNSTLLYFFRIVKDTDPSLLQDYVSSTLEHLEELHGLSLDPKVAQMMHISPPFWCFFICGSDAMDTGLQSRYDSLGRIWFAAGDKWIGKQMMMEIWRGRNLDDDFEEEHASWLDMVKGWEVSGFH